MKISGFTFVKNAVKYGYPVVESITSILPLVDEMIVCLGDSDDETNALIGSIGSDKIRIVHSVWDPTLREGGKVLAEETDKAMDATSSGSNWLFYIQADEVVHEQYLPVIRSAMERYRDDSRVEGLLFNYHHFYGSYQYIGDGRKWYSKEIRVIRNDKNIRSYLDAQGFRWKDGRKLNVKLINAWIYHYGWVKNPLKMYEKFIDFGRNWHDDESQRQWVEKYLKENKAEFNYAQIDTLSEFTGSHPAVMQGLIAKADWKLDIDIRRKNFKDLKHRLLYVLWKRFGIRPFEYRNYNRI